MISSAVIKEKDIAASYQTGVERKGIDFKTKSEYMSKQHGIHIDENTLFVLSSESRVKLGYMGEFFRVSVNSSGGHSELVENTSRKYSELRSELQEKYKNDENKMFKELGELNQAFETALKNTCLMPAYAQKVNTEIRTSYNETDRIRNESEIAEISRQNNIYNKNTKNVLDNFQNNMMQHMDTFYLSFIEKIQTNDFDTAFSDSMALLQNSETSSNKEISYNDIINIRETIVNEATKFDKDGRPVEYRYNTSEDAFRALIKNTNISYIIRKDVADSFGFDIREE